MEPPPTENEKEKIKNERKFLPENKTENTAVKEIKEPDTKYNKVDVKIFKEKYDKITIKIILIFNFKNNRTCDATSELKKSAKIRAKLITRIRAKFVCGTGNKNLKMPITNPDINSGKKTSCQYHFHFSDDNIFRKVK